MKSQKLIYIPVLGIHLIPQLKDKFRVRKSCASRPDCLIARGAVPCGPCVMGKADANTGSYFTSEKVVEAQ